MGVNLITPVIPWALLWLPGVLGAGLLAVACGRTARTEHLPPPIRRFWRHIWVGAVLVGLGVTAQAAHVIGAHDPANLQMGAGQMLFDGLAILIVMWALIRLPFGSQTRGDTFRLVLDAGTVMLACAVFVWHFATRYSLHADDTGLVYISLALSVLALLSVFAMAKFLLASQVLFDRGALRMIAVAVVVGAVGPLLRPLFTAIDPQLYPDMIDILAVYLFVALAAERQRRATYGPRRGVAPARRRTFSVLPYAAVAAVDGLLVAVTWNTGSADRRIVVVSAVILTALVVLRQITAFRDNGRLLRRLDHGATHDALTQLPNRVLFHERLDKALTSPGDRPVAVALIDLDDFKEVNDTLGHEVGDLLLIAVAQRLAGCVRAEDTVARLGGDEFVLVLDGADPAAADLAAQRMIEALREPVVADGHELPIRASIGIADGRSGDDPSLLLRRADIAMYAAKALPGTAFLHYDHGMAASDQSYLGAELREAIRDNQLFLLYQPIVSLADGRVLGAEALVRWAHPVHGTLAPDAFIPVAERTGLIVPMGRWVIRRAVRDLAGWSPEIVLNINISARDLREPGFAFFVGALLEAYEIDGSRIALEVTESMPIDAEASAANLADLRARGVRVSLDDFGTGASTLTMLHDVPVDELKLDRAFTQAAPDARVPVAAAVLQVAGALGLNAVAEGVETRDQADRLRDLGYRAAQGFLFARPMPAADFTEMVERDWPSRSGVLRTA
ncbi:putative bifunctional diguanylate cyclase/phosphodiesterase [Actinoplanes sp. CA-131856]